MDFTDIAAAKRTLRQDLMARRRAFAASPDARAAASRAIARHVLRLLPLADGVQVSVFWTFGDEIDTLPLLNALDALGATVCLPRLRGKDHPLAFHPWRPGDTLIPHRFGPLEPSADLPELLPQILLVPLLGFDGLGFRLGYGGGFYDRTLHLLRTEAPEPLAIGLAFACQEVPALPREPFDEHVAMVVTENGPRLFTPAPRPVPRKV